ncbi:magnesium/cobalt transporter CorA [Waterburya agarophytonicola K14]|uniref:Magnesium transport protein CorA n=1 Tax=Waterburya agarophytonicola KI4 TaxID=2874699 RepID=A0A964BNS5_9CYAN|nr:magnesium/cobalt transporter CorA [Waterburya agarophytonicola]MCC0175411.1 magnesium/cobalt transporter CorA [Waterburya agarophytonicola KI4]
MSYENQVNQEIGLPPAQKEEEEDLFDYSYEQPGSIPGTLNIEADAETPDIVLIDYSRDHAHRINNLTPEACAKHLNTESVSWVDVKGLGSEDILQRLGKVFDLHPLVLEDVVNVPQRPKVEDYTQQLVVITQMVVPKPSGEGFWLEQVSLVVGKNYLLTVQEKPEKDCFLPVRRRIQYNKGSIREMGADYLAYALWDAIIDGFFPVLEIYGEKIEDLEDEVLFNPSNSSLADVYQVKRELLALRRAIWPQRNALNTLIRDGSSFIDPDILIFLRDCYDHTVQIIDIIETYRELAASLTDIYLSAISNKMNEVMKLLTVISSIFIPLTFIAGIYGMNFNSSISPLNMPELDWYWGYPMCWGLMLATAASLIYFFWRRGWFEDFSKIPK